MRVFLVYPPIWYMTGWRTSCNNGMGLLYIGAVLRKNGHDVRIVDSEVLGWTNDEVVSEIEKWGATHVGISCLSNGLQSASELSKKIREKLPNVWIALGGPGPSAEPELALKITEADSVSVGESELILDKSFGERGIHAGIIPENLDDLPDAAYDLLEPKVGSPLWTGNLPVPSIPHVKEIMVMWSRGCPHPCTFCSKASMKRGATRMRSAERIVSELKMLQKEYGINSIFVYDDELIGMGEKHNEWIYGVVHLILEEIDEMVFKGQGRCSEKFIKDDGQGLLFHMKQAGFFAMMMGCESGSEIVKEHLRKHTTNEDIRHTLKTINKYGIDVFGFWMIGMPLETTDEAKKTEQLIIEMAPYMKWIQVSVFSPLIGSDFWKEAEDSGWLHNFDRTKNFQVEPMLKMPWMNGDEILRWQKKLYSAFQWGKKNADN